MHLLVHGARLFVSDICPQCDLGVWLEPANCSPWGDAAQITDYIIFLNPVDVFSSLVNLVEVS